MERKTKSGKINKTFEIIRSILEVAPFGVYIVNSKGNIDYLNSVMVAISGDTYEQFKSLNVFTVPGDKKLGLDEKIRSVFEGHSFVIEGVYYTSYHSKKSTFRNFIGIPLEEGNEKKALIFVEDITKIKQAEEELKKTTDIKLQFVSMVSHELRSPLAAIQGAINLVAEGDAGSFTKSQKEFLDIAKRNVERLVRLTNNVLDYQKLEAGRVEFQREKGDINRLIEDVAESMMPLAKEKGLEVKVLLADGIPTISFDKDKIIQVLTNLVSNAIKFTNKGSVTVSSKKIENAVCVSVADTGIGIKKEDMTRLFRSFSQIPQEAQAKKEGTGLGLAISKKIIQEHGGKIETMSEYGKGTVFTVFLPIMERRR